MDTILSYLREFTEFEESYQELKNACLKINPYIDSIKLTDKNIDPAFGIPLDKYFDLLVDHDFEYMQIVER